MVAVDTDARAWQLGFETLEHEQLDEQELEVKGLVPLDLDGRLFSGDTGALRRVRRALPPLVRR